MWWSELHAQRLPLETLMGTSLLEAVESRGLEPEPPIYATQMVLCRAPAELIPNHRRPFLTGLQRFQPLAKIPPLGKPRNRSYQNRRLR